jgi:hypothetical protein
MIDIKIGDFVKAISPEFGEISCLVDRVYNRHDLSYYRVLYKDKGNLRKINLPKSNVEVDVQRNRLEKLEKLGI